MDTKRYVQAVEARLDEQLGIMLREAPTEEARLLIKRIRTLIQRGGKRARPQLLYLTYHAYGGNRPATIVNLGAALEIHHQFLLIHDDLIDDDTVRYDGPNIVGYYRQDFPDKNRSIAEAMGLLAGDLLFSLSNSMILSDVDLSESQKVQLLRYIQEVNVCAAYGQQLDSFNTDAMLEKFSVERLSFIHLFKTARYTIQLPMQCAAILRTLRSSERSKIDAFAQACGVFFQLVDDFSDYFQNSSAFNDRPKYRDYRQGKITHPLYAGLALAGPNDVALLKKHLGEKKTSEKLMERVVSVLEQSGAEAASRGYIEKYHSLANDALDTLDMSLESKQQFANMLAQFNV